MFVISFFLWHNSTKNEVDRMKKGGYFFISVLLMIFLQSLFVTDLMDLLGSILMVYIILFI